MADWLREMGWRLPHASDKKPTHLLLDGGKACVPNDSGAAFLNAYALAIVRNMEPCIVELRTTVFKLFVDLDVKTAAGDDLDFDAVMRVLQRCASQFYDVDEPRAIVCDTPPRTCGECVKAGRHVVWTNIFCTSATALAFRAVVVDELESALAGACTKPWSVIVDSCVFTSNGLRMPFSGKGRGNMSTYEPRAVWSGQTCVEDVAAITGVSAVRQWVHALSIRTFGVDETCVRDGVSIPETPIAEGLRGTARSLKEYANVLAELDAALPVQFAGQRFTGLIKAESCFILRSSSTYCLNLGRPHNSCGIYWILTVKGIRQACYCRCDTEEGRRYGKCKDFKSDVWSVPDTVLAAFFGADSFNNPADAPKTQMAAVATSVLPSAAMADNFARRMACSRPCLAPPRRKRKTGGR